MTISVVILTFNSEDTIGKTLEKAKKVSDDIHVVDSFSADRTLEILKENNVNVVQRPFESYGAQRNWAIENLPLKYPWELHLDADEWLSDKLIALINSLKGSFPDQIDGYFIRRNTMFLGRELHHAGHSPWHMRLFRHGKGHCENRRYDQHYYVVGKTEQLNGAMIDDMRMSLNEWITRHNKWASAEALEIYEGESSGRITPALLGNPVQKIRFLRLIYESFPLFVRPFLYFFYRYFLRLGFLDGKEGLIYIVLQSFWFRFLVDAKFFELQLSRNRER